MQCDFSRWNSFARHLVCIASYCSFMDGVYRMEIKIFKSSGEVASYN